MTLMGVRHKRDGMFIKPQRTILALLNPVLTYILHSKNINLRVSQPGENERVWF